MFKLLVLAYRLHFTTLQSYLVGERKTLALLHHMVDLSFGKGNLSLQAEISTGV